MQGANKQTKVAIVTGAAGSIGSAIVGKLSSDGICVAATDIRHDDVEALAARIRDEGGHCEGFVADLSSQTEIEKLVAEVAERFGRIDFLVNNATSNILPKDVIIHELDPEVWDHTFAVNVRAPMLLTKYTVPHILKHGDGGAIVNISSGAAEIPDANGMASYGSAKSALNGLTRYISAQYGPLGIRCNAVMPGVVFTKGMREMFDKERLDAMVSRTMTKRGCEPEDISEMVGFLLSDGARQVNAELIRVSGGRI